VFIFNFWIDQNDSMSNSTILTQGIMDWGANSWVDFTWAENTCPQGYEALGNEWEGMNPGNYTEYRIVWAEKDHEYSTDLPEVKPVFQTKMFADMPNTVICGKRGDLSYLTGVRADKEEASHSYFCPEGTTACSSNTDASGATYCVAD